MCPDCGKVLSGSRGIEVSQVFKLGTKYSEAMGATFMDADGVEKPYIMGCYGIGVTRSLAAVVEQRNDENGICWPASIAPAHVCVIPLQMGDDLVEPLASRLAGELEAAGIEVALDDRDERAGVKFADADLIGWPYQLIVGKRGAQNDVVEFKDRATGDKVEFDVSAAVSHVIRVVRGALEALEPVTTSI